MDIPGLHWLQAQVQNSLECWLQILLCAAKNVQFAASGNFTPRSETALATSETQQEQKTKEIF